MVSPLDAELHTFVTARYVHLRRTAYLLCGDWHRAEDLVQTALARLVAAARRRKIDSLDAYARRILLGVFLDERRGSRRHENSTAELGDWPAPGSDRDVALSLLAALRSLPPRQRAVVVLRYWEDRSVEETADALGIATGTVKSQCAKGLATLRAALGDSQLQPIVHTGGTP